MINVSEAYKQACESGQRQSYVIAKYGLYDKKAKGNISNVASDSQLFSNIDKTYNEIKDTNYNYISCEPNRVKLNGSFYFINDKEKPNASENLAYWSYNLSNEDGYFSQNQESYYVENETLYIENASLENDTLYLINETVEDNTLVLNSTSPISTFSIRSTTPTTNTNPKIVYTFSSDITFSEITLYFQEVCEEFNVYYYSNDTLIATRKVTNNNSLKPTTQGASTLNSTNTFNKLEIEFIKTKYPYRYVKFNEIDFGVLQQFTDKQIVDYDIIDELSIDSSELSSNSLDLRIDNSNGDYDILNPKNKLSLLQERQEIAMYHYLKVGNVYKEIPLGTFLVKEFEVSNQALRIEAYDDVYFMNKIYYGSLYYQNEEVTKILEDLFKYFNYTKYEIDSELQGIKLTGYIPNVEFREALRLIAEASGCVVSKTRYGITYIFKTYDPISKVFNRKIIDKEKPSRNLFNNVIDIVEYNYTNVLENQEVYNATLEQGTHTILFNKLPIIEGTLIKGEENENYSILNTYATSCIIKVLRPTNVKLKATIVSQESIVKRFKKSENISFDEYAITKINNKLITTNNSQNVAQWKLGRGDIKYNFDTPLIPYIEVGDTCQYVTRFNTKNTFIPTRLEFSKSIIQKIEGE